MKYAEVKKVWGAWLRLRGFNVEEAEDLIHDALCRLTASFQPPTEAQLQSKDSRVYKAARKRAEKFANDPNFRRLHEIMLEPDPDWDPKLITVAVMMAYRYWMSRVLPTLKPLVYFNGESDFMDTRCEEQFRHLCSNNRSPYYETALLWQIETCLKDTQFTLDKLMKALEISEKRPFGNKTKERLRKILVDAVAIYRRESPPDVPSYC